MPLDNRFPIDADDRAMQQALWREDSPPTMDGSTVDVAEVWARRAMALSQLSVQFTKRAVNAVSNVQRDISSHAVMAQIFQCLHSASGNREHMA